MIPFDFDFTLRGKGYFEKAPSFIDRCGFCNGGKTIYCCYTYSFLGGFCKYRLLDYRDWYKN